MRIIVVFKQTETWEVLDFEADAKFVNETFATFVRFNKEGIEQWSASYALSDIHSIEVIEAA